MFLSMGEIYNEIEYRFKEQNVKYSSYSFERIGCKERIFNEKSIYVYEIQYKKIFFNLLNRKKKNYFEIDFTRMVVSSPSRLFNWMFNNIYYIDVAIDDINKIIYWKYRYFDISTPHMSGGFGYNSRNDFNSAREKDSQQSELQKHLNFLNIGNKPYSKESLKSYYRKLSKQYHPDIIGGDGEMMAKINISYEYIMKTL